MSSEKLMVQFELKPTQALQVYCLIRDRYNEYFNSLIGSVSSEDRELLEVRLTVWGRLLDDYGDQLNTVLEKGTLADDRSSKIEP